MSILWEWNITVWSKSDYKLSYLFSFKKNSKKQTETIQDQAEKQIKITKTKVEKQLLETDKKPIASLFSKEFLYEEDIYELNKVVEIEQKINRDDLIYKTDNKKGQDIWFSK